MLLRFPRYFCVSNLNLSRVRQIAAEFKKIISSPYPFYFLRYQTNLGLYMNGLTGRLRRDQWSKTILPWRIILCCFLLIFLIGRSRPLFLYFRLFNTVDGKQMFYIKVSQWLDLNCRPRVSEATTLPTEPPPLPDFLSFAVLFELETLDEFTATNLRAANMLSSSNWESAFSSHILPR